MKVGKDLVTDPYQIVVLSIRLRTGEVAIEDHYVETLYVESSKTSALGLQSLTD
jgi:hypothetical protein